MLYAQRLSIFALEYAIRKVQESQMGLRYNGINLLQACADDMILPVDNVVTAKRRKKFT
jgi:hypothetical protein